MCFTSVSTLFTYLSVILCYLIDIIFIDKIRKSCYAAIRIILARKRDTAYLQNWANLVLFNHTTVQNCGFVTNKALFVMALLSQRLSYRISKSIGILDIKIPVQEKYWWTKISLFFPVSNLWWVNNLYFWLNIDHIPKYKLDSLHC